MHIFLKRYQSLYRVAKPLGVLVIFGLSMLVYYVVQHNQQSRSIHKSDIVMLSPQNIALDTHVADTVQERKIGLSNHIELQENQAMLFVFDRPGNYSFWMKDMDFPIDIFWLNQYKQVMNIKKYADPADYPESYYPEAEALYVVETVAGFADKYAIEYGQTFSWEE